MSSKVFPLSIDGVGALVAVAVAVVVDTVVEVAGAPRAVEGAAGFAPNEKEGAEVAGADQSTQGNINFESILMIMQLFTHQRYSLMWQEA
jgi:hypothetical protein